MQFEKWFQIDLDRPRAHPVDLGFPVFSGDNDSVRVGVEVTRNGAAQTISGTVSGHIILPSGATVPTTSINADSDGNRAWIDLPESAFALQGRIQLAIRVTDGTTKTVLLSASATVRLTETSTAYDPSNEVPTSSEMIDAYEDCLDAITHNTNPVSYVAQTLLDAEKTQARANISAADAGLVDALHGLVDYGYGTTTTAVNGLTRQDMIVSITKTHSSGTYVSGWRMDGTVVWALQKSAMEGWRNGLKLQNGHKYRFAVHRISGVSEDESGQDANVAQALVVAPGVVDRPGSGSGSRIYGIAPTVLCGTTDSYVDFVYDASVYEAESLDEDMQGVILAIRAYRGNGFVATNAVFLVTLEDITGIVREIPAVPVTDGTYTLKATVTNGVPSYAWVSDGGASLLSAPPTLTGGESD